MLKVVGVLCLFIVLRAVDLSISLVNRGQNIIIPLQTYLKNVSQAQKDISRFQPSNLQYFAHINIEDPLTTIFNVSMEFELNNKTQNLSQYKIYYMKEIYNQPLRIFLLSNNTLLLLIYHEHSCEKQENITIISYQINRPKSKCLQLQVMEDLSFYRALVLCSNQNSNQREVIWFKLLENNEGYIQGIKEMSSKNLPTAVFCNQFGIKFLKNVTITKDTYFLYKSYIYCKDSSKNYKDVYYATFTRNSIDFIPLVPDKNPEMLNCFTNSSKIFQYQNGFIAVRSQSQGYKQQILYQYLHAPGSIQSCEPLFQLDGYLRVTSQTEIMPNGKENIQIFVIFPDKIIVKESSLANKQTFTINPDNYTITSYALTSQYLFIEFNQANQSYISVYTLTEPTVRQIDRIYLFKNLSDSLSGITNYLQSSSYFFIYDKFKNILYLTKYNGYNLNIKVIDPIHFEKKCKVVITTANKTKNEISQQLVIYMTISDIDSQQIIKNPIQIYNFDSEIFKIDLSKLYIGPTPRFYIKNQTTSQIQFINQFQSLSIANFIKYNNLSLIEIAINTELQYPVISFFYPGLYQMTCSLIFNNATALFQVGKCGSAIQLKTDMSKPKRVLVLSRNRYLQFNDTRVEYCSITSTNEVNICEKLYEDTFIIKRIKLVNYCMAKNYSESIELIVIGLQMAFFVTTTIQNGKSNFSINFNVTNKQISELNTMEIRQLFIDPGYKKYMVLHLQPINKTGNQQGAIKVFDRPIVSPEKKKFIGHLIGEIQEDNIKGVMYIASLDLLIVITQRDDICTIKQYIILTSYELVMRRQYPTYGKKCRVDSYHVSDGNKIFIEFISDNKNLSKQYYVYEPSQATTNLFIYNLVVDLRSEIQFVQKIGASTQTIGRINDTIFTVGLPQLIYSIDKQEFNSTLNSQQPINTKEIKLALLEKSKTFSLVTIPYTINNSKYQIITNIKNSQININSSQLIFMIPSEDIRGPVTNYTLDNSNCQFVTIQQEDLFDKIQCIQYFNPLQYGVMFDFVTFKTKTSTVELIITNRYYICIDNKSKVNEIKLEYIADRCNMTHKDASKVFVVCVVNQNSIIQFLQIHDTCSSLTRTKVQTPSWLTYQYFRLKYLERYVVFQIPVRVSYQSFEYFCGTFDQSTNKISENYTILSRLQKRSQNQQFQFGSLDYTLGNGYILILQDGIGIFQMISIDQKVQILDPAKWINKSYIYQVIQSQQQIQPLAYIDSIDSDSKQTIKFQLGTKTHSYEMLYDGRTEQLRVLYTYQQISYCFNTLKSKPRFINNMTVRICSFEPQKFSIFGNFYPILRLDRQNYLQFFTKNNEGHSYPFRMESINSDFFVINREGYMCTGSRLNFACYYIINKQLTWKFKYNQQKSQQGSDETEQQNCIVKITLMNQKRSQIVNLRIVNQIIKDEYLWQQQIIRVIFILFLINFIRIWIKYRKQAKKQKRKHYANMFSNQFERQLSQYKKKQT